MQSFGEMLISLFEVRIAIANSEITFSISKNNNKFINQASKENKQMIVHDKQSNENNDHKQ